MGLMSRARVTSNGLLSQRFEQMRKDTRGMPFRKVFLWLLEFEENHIYVHEIAFHLQLYSLCFYSILATSQ